MVVLRSFRAIGAMVTIALATGCAGNGPASASHVLPAEPASAKRAAQPGAAGDTYRYSGTLVQTSGTGRTRTAVSQTVTVTTARDPFSYEPGALDFHSTETDRSAAGASVWSGDAWRGYGPATQGVAPFLSYAQRRDDGKGDAQSDDFVQPQTLDERPERNGSVWSNGAAELFAETAPNGIAAHANVSADGSYAERVRYSNACAYGVPCVLDVNANSGGSAAYSGSALLANGIASIALGAPIAGRISIAYTYAGGTTQSISIPAWFSSGAVLYRESDRITTGVPFPSWCAAPPSYGRFGNLIVRNVARIDPAAGTRESDVTQSYTTPSYGTVCVQDADSISTYYDFANGAFSGSPLSTAGSTETLSLQRASLTNGLAASGGTFAGPILRQRGNRRDQRAPGPARRPRAWPPGPAGSR